MSTKPNHIANPLTWIITGPTTPIGCCVFVWSQGPGLRGAFSCAGSLAGDALVGQSRSPNIRDVVLEASASARGGLEAVF